MKAKKLKLEPEADLIGANLAGRNLAGIDLELANLELANLSGANLNGASLYDAGLICTNLTGADLQDADLRDADLRAANFQNANLSGANLSGANLSGASLTGATLNETLMPSYSPFTVAWKQDGTVQIGNTANSIQVWDGQFGNGVVLVDSQSFEVDTADFERLQAAYIAAKTNFEIWLKYGA